MQDQPSDHRYRVPGSYVIQAILLISLFLLIWHLVKFVFFAIHSTNFYYGIDFGEGIIWQQAILMFTPRMYGDINAYPYVVFHYTPLYHIIVRFSEYVGVDILAFGRALSIVCILWVCALVGAMARRMLVDQGIGNAQSILIAVFSGLLLLSFKPIWFWSVLFRSDMLALLLTFGGFALMFYAFRNEALGHVAMVLFVLAVYSKQTFIAAPVVAWGVWALRDFRVALRLAVTGLLLGGTILGTFVWLTSGGFFKHIFLYNINPFSIRMLVYNFWTQRIFVLYSILAIAAMLFLIQRGRAAYGIGNWSTFRGSLREDPRVYRLTLVVLYLVASALMSITMGKEGASFNYLIEWFAIACVALACLLGWSAFNVSNRTSLWAGTAVAVALAIQLSIVPSPRISDPEAARTKINELDALTEMARNTPKPVLSDNMVVLMRAGKEVPLESAIFAALSRVGAWDQAPFVAMIARRDFAFIISDGDDDSSLFRERYTPEMRAAIREAYPVKRRMGGHVIHMPPE